MPPFKRPVNQADRHKTKGNWIIARPANRALAGWTTGKRCRFFELPAELRKQIYELVFTPPTTIVFRNQEANAERRDNRKGMPRKTKQPMKPDITSPTIRCGRELSRGNECERVNTKWCTSVSGIILASRRTYHEAIPILYEQTIFHFGVFKLARSFLKVISKLNCDSVRQLQLYHRTWSHGSTADARLAKEKADAGFRRLCGQFATALPNVISLEVAVKIYEHPDRIVPTYSDPVDAITVKLSTELSWVQALKAFATLSKLTHVTVELLDMPDDALECWFGCDSSYREVTPYSHRDPICRRWIDFRHSLYRSLGEAVRRLIMGFEGDAVWEEHMAGLEKYRAFCWDQLAPTAKTIADPRYAAFVAKYVRK
ncbi:hypothetical protein LTR36_007888 [Oleoguttula mirabilis]|uniref:DUF7730 domain-containing protein n=1 Tax=Oleoguttula mirabilis TaxID=1507867 RepID=A0AAV9JA03_9PEZI|nr:hypothetical protein LTR36_007888 [Oleoguttula mirabilis]